MSDFFEHSDKKRKLLDELNLDSLGGDTSEDKPTEYIDVDEITEIKYHNCFACKYINNETLAENDTYRAMMKLYTNNSTSISLDAIFRLIKEFYDNEIKPCTGVEWSLEAIKEHFTKHTNYPTDEILRQITIKRALRNSLANNSIEKLVDGSLKFNLNNIKLVVTLDKELITLYKLKKDIANMIGYSESLNY